MALCPRSRHGTVPMLTPRRCVYTRSRWSARPSAHPETAPDRWHATEDASIRPARLCRVTLTALLVHGEERGEHEEAVNSRARHIVRRVRLGNATIHEGAHIKLRPRHSPTPAHATTRVLVRTTRTNNPHAQHTLNTRSTHVQHTLNTRPRHAQHTLNTRSTHAQHTLKTRSRHAQDTLKTRSRHAQDTLKTRSRHAQDTLNTRPTHAQMGDQSHGKGDEGGLGGSPTATPPIPAHPCDIAPPTMN